jgi:glycosyltransferase involved in cell wall biosynthesis
LVADKPFVSIIIPTKNSSSTFPCLLKSISKQKYARKEIIVVDNHSSDQTREIALKWGANVLLVQCERSKARNLGAKRARGEYLLFLDSDMELSDGVIADCLHVVLTGGYGACIIREISNGAGYWAEVRSLERRTYEGGSPFETAVFFKKDAFTHVGGFNENLVGFEDYDLQVRLEKADIRIGYSKTPIIHHEGKLILSKHLMKKRYYVRTGKDYIFGNKYRSLTQFLPIKYVFVRNWRILKEKPACTVGIFILKSLETIIGFLSIFG